MITLLDEIDKNCRQYRFVTLLEQTKSARQLLSKKSINISIFGQFKAGKSSFINNIIGKPVLPTGVIPVTSVITSIQYGQAERAFIDFEGGRIEEVQLAHISDYVTEGRNPGNIKKVEKARIELPGMERFRGLMLTDTPGLGSIFLNNSRTTSDNFALTSIAVVCISAERPLSERDIELTNHLIQNSYKVICMLTKVDLFTADQTKEIMDFIQKSLQKKTGIQIPVYKYSIISDNDIYRKKVQDEIFLPYLKDFDFETGQIARHKILNLANSCLEYLNLASNVSLKTDEGKAFLKAKIFDEKMNMSFIRHELTLIASDSKSHVRESVFNIIEPYIKDSIAELEEQFYNDFNSWKGNLYTVTRIYEDWLKTLIGERMLNIIEIEKQAFENILIEVNSKFCYYTRTFRERIEGRVYELLKLKVSPQEWLPSFNPMKKPDISVYPTFDTPIDLLWFLFPMFIFRPLFKRYFRKQIKAELLKNAHRTTSLISENIFKEIDLNQAQVLDYIHRELQTIEHALSAMNSKTAELSEEINRLKHRISEIA